MDADVIDKYPNYRYNWDTPEQFIRDMVRHIESDGKDSNGINSFGYSINVGKK